MIIILSDVSDPALTTAAQNAHNSNAAAFGTVYAIGNNIPVLGISEDLFILAHGAAVGDQGIPVIGSAASDFYLDAAAFLITSGAFFLTVIVVMFMWMLAILEIRLLRYKVCCVRLSPHLCAPE